MLVGKVLPLPLSVFRMKSLLKAVRCNLVMVQMPELEI
jgi:hypothetical protein